MRNKRLLILRGDAYCKNLLRIADRIGIDAYVTDRDSSSPAKEMAKKKFNVDFSDYEKMKQLIQAEEIDGVFSGYSDDNLLHAQKICKMNGLFFWGTEEQVAISMDKKRFKELCDKYSIPVIDTYYVGDRLTEETLNNVQYPVVIKPIDGSGSRGVCICWDREELLEGFDAAIAESRQKEIIIERYMTGMEVIMDYIVIDGDIRLQAMGEKRISNDRRKTPTNHANLIYFPSQYLDKYMRGFDELVKNMFRELGFQNGIIFVQAFYENEKFYVCEMGYRLGGCFSEIVEHYSRYSPIEQLMYFSLYGDMGHNLEMRKINPRFHGVGGVLSILVKKGHIKTITGLDSVLQREDVVNCIMLHKEGDDLTNTLIVDNSIARLFIVADNDVLLEKSISEILQEITVLDSDGKNMVLPFEGTMQDSNLARKMFHDGGR